jgi:hypothetical protein
MRVSAMVVGILLAIWTFFEAALLSGLEEVAGSDENMAGGGGLASILCGLAAILVLSVPQISMVLFGLGAASSFAAASQGYGNHYVYGSIMVLLAVMAFFGWRGKKADRRERLAERARQEERDRRMEELLRQQRPITPPGELTCPSCGQQNTSGSRFCASCGAPLGKAPTG